MDEKTSITEDKPRTLSERMEQRIQNIRRSRIGAFLITAIVAVGALPGAVSAAMDWTNISALITGAAGIMPAVTTLIMGVVEPIMTVMILGFVFGVFGAILLGLKNGLNFNWH